MTAPSTGVDLHIRLSADERAELDQYAQTERLVLSQAARRLMRLGARGAAKDPGSVSADRATATIDFLTELGMISLVAVEQVLQLLESITPKGPGAGGTYLIPAVRAAQERIARGAATVPDQAQTK